MSGPGESRAHTALRQAAECLAAVHQVPAESLLPGRPTRDYQSFATAFRSHALNLLPAFRRAGFDGPGELLELQSSGFFTRVGDRMSIADARPKNIIVRPAGGVSFIDLDCAPAPPALGVALFLVALDRLASRYPYIGAAPARRKSMFVEAYGAAVDSNLAEDLTFFYPWSVVQMLRQHSAQRPAMRPYLTWYYSRALDRFLTALRRVPASRAADMPALLFQGWSDRGRHRATCVPQVASR